MTRPEKAVELFNQGFSCSQAVISAYADAVGLDPETALKVAAGFGGGMGRMAGTCGAITGAVMILGLKFGGATAENAEAKEKTYKRVRELVARFKARHGTMTCCELLGQDISTPEGLREAKDQQLFTTRCPKFVQSAAEILEELI